MELTSGVSLLFSGQKWEWQLGALFPYKITTGGIRRFVTKTMAECAGTL